MTLHKRGVSSENSLDIVDVKGRFVFVGAGGMSLIMLEKVRNYDYLGLLYCALLHMSVLLNRLMRAI